MRATAVVLALWLCGCCWKGDCLHVHDAAPDEMFGVLVDGRDASGEVNDRTFAWAWSKLDVGPLDDSSISNDVVCFCNRRPVLLAEDIRWEPGRVHANVRFEKEIEIPITIWILQAPFETHKARAVDHICWTTRVWSSERMGVRFSDVVYKNATEHDNVETFLEFDSDAHHTKIQDPTEGIGADAGRINVYFVYDVDGKTYRGHTAITGDTIAIGSTAGSDLLVHELGHSFFLDHPEDGSYASLFDHENVMWGVRGETPRLYFTEGQLFLAHVVKQSSLNAIYDARPNQPAYPWAGSGSFTERHAHHRVPIWKRIFPDGAFWLEEPAGP